MQNFKIESKFSPSEDQEKAIEGIVAGFQSGNKYQTLLGVTGSGKTFTMANIIKRLGIPALVMTHNKSLAAQLYSEFKGFFPQNHVEYFISYYDYYQPEAYIPRQDLFIEKDSDINQELERLRLSATASLLSFDDVITVASVSANYGLGDPAEYKGMVLFFEIGSKFSTKFLLRKLVDMGYKRNDDFFDRGNFRVNGDVIDIYPAYFNDEAFRVEFFGDEIEAMYHLDVLENKKTQSVKKFILYPTSQFIVGEQRLKSTIKGIEEELEQRLKFFEDAGKLVEAQRLEQRTLFDLEMLQELGFCKGIENYSRHLSGARPGEPPPTLIDYLPPDALMFIDESHVTIGQLGGMYRGDRARKDTLVQYGFRLPSALDNRPLTFEEFESKVRQCIFVSATPSEYEASHAGQVVEQVVRPTGLVDPEVEVRPATTQVDDVLSEITARVARGHRVLVTTLTKRMAEDLTDFLADHQVRVRYLHSDIDTVERVEIIRDLRLGVFDVLVGINLLREGLDIPEVSLVAILDADKEGFLRSERSLIQTIGRAARNLEGKAILYADQITRSMQRAIDETARRRQKQLDFNAEHGIVPRGVVKQVRELIDGVYDLSGTESRPAAPGAAPGHGLGGVDDALLERTAEKLQGIDTRNEAQVSREIRRLEKQMATYARNLDFEKAAQVRDELAALKQLLFGSGGQPS